MLKKRKKFLPKIKKTLMGKYERSKMLSDLVDKNWSQKSENGQKYKTTIIKIMKFEKSCVQKYENS